MQTDHIDLMVRYALAVAGEADDYRDRELGPIHLLKYVYLADLAFARDNPGKVFSESHWTFYKFGPWSAEVHTRIADSVKMIGAQERHFASRYREDNVRWRLLEGDTARLEARLPPSVARAIKRGVTQFSNDTVSLLHYVYKTPPMLAAAPGEMLDFGSEVMRREVLPSPPAVEVATPLPSISKTKLKKLKEKIDRLYQEKKERGQRQLVAPDPPPVYDEVYFDGLEWLDGLAGSPIESTRGKLAFDESIWKSEGRRDPELP